jgi:hypothetical protein
LCIEIPGADTGHVALRVSSLEQLAGGQSDETSGGEEILALRRWVVNPSQASAAYLTDDAMYSVLSKGSLVAIDLSATDPNRLNGRIVVACPEETPMIRRLDVIGRHLILRPSLPGRDSPLIALEIGDKGRSPILGEVIFSWNRFHEA